jgi:beta-glucosidase
LKKGILTEADIDRALRGNFRVMIRLGLLDPPERVPYASIGNEPIDPWLTDKHKALALRAAQESIVLLKNSANVLPLDKTALKSIAVIGPRANEVLLDWYSGTPPYSVSPLDGIRKFAGSTVKVSYAANNDGDAAVKAARESDVAIVCVGNHPNGGFDTQWARVSVPSEGREAVDRQSITLEQEELIKAVFQANPKTIVVLKSSFPYAINWTQENVPAILHLALNNQEEGTALASVIFGDYNPAGRLVQTWPKSLEQLPPMMDYDIRHGRTYMYFRDTPLYQFGYGLSYTTFAYRDLRVNRNGESIDVSVALKNTGRRAGDEVVQLYVKHLDSKVARPLKELKGFTRITLAPQDEKIVKLSVPVSRLAYWNADRWVVEKDQIEITVGGSSTDARVKKSIRL